MIEVNQRPLVSYIQIAYNQQDFIKQSIEGAFSQTYSPMEIIISDNASSDDTYEIIKAMAKSYRGPHKLILNRNVFNGGVSHNINRAVSLASGEFVVYGAGDDVSLPNRVSRLIEAWEAGGRRAYSIYSNCTVINTDGKILGPYFRNSTPRHAKTVDDAIRCKAVNIPGIVHAYRRSLFEKYGPLPAKYMWDDEPVSFRSLLDGEIVYLHEELLLYRWHSSNLSMNSGKYPTLGHYHKARLPLVLGWIEVFDSWISDLRKWAGFKSDEQKQQVDKWIEELRRHQRFLQVEVEILKRSKIMGLLYGFRSVIAGTPSSDVLRNIGRAWMHPYLRKKILDRIRQVD